MGARSCPGSSCLCFCLGKSRHGTKQAHVNSRSVPVDVWHAAVATKVAPPSGGNCACTSDLTWLGYWQSSNPVAVAHWALIKHSVHLSSFMVIVRIAAATPAIHSCRALAGQPIRRGSYRNRRTFFWYALGNICVAKTEDIADWELNWVLRVALPSFIPHMPEVL